MANGLPEGFVLENPDDQYQTADLAPSNQSTEQIMQQSLKPTPKPTGRGNIANSMLQGLSFGWGDEALAGVLAAYGTLMPESMGGLPDQFSLQQNYEGLRDTIRDADRLYAEENPAKAFMGEMGGALLTGGAGLGKFGAKQGMGMGERLVRNAGVGAAEGAVYGGGQAEDMESIPEEAAKGATYGAVFGAAGGEVMDQFSKYFSKKSAAKDQIIEKIMSGVDDSDTALFNVVEDIKTGTQRLEKDPLAKELEKQGMDKGVIAAIKLGNQADKGRMNKMAKIKQKGLKNVRYEMENRPGDVVGNSLLERFYNIRRVNKEAGQAIDRESQKLKGKKVDFSPAVNQFIGDLEKIGVSLEKKGNRIVPNFSKAAFQDIPEIENMVRNLVKRMSRGTNLDAHDVHLMKKFIDERVTYGAGGTGLKGNVKRVMKDLRHNLDSVLDQNFDDYRKANDIYAETIDSLDELQKLANMQIKDADGNDLIAPYRS